MDHEKFRHLVAEFATEHSLERVLTPFIRTVVSEVSCGQVKICLYKQGTKLFVQFWHRIVGSYSYWWHNDEVYFNRLTEYCSRINNDEKFISRFFDLYGQEYGCIGLLYGLK